MTSVVFQKRERQTNFQNYNGQDSAHNITPFTINFYPRNWVGPFFKCSHIHSQFIFTQFIEIDIR